MPEGQADTRQETEMLGSRHEDSWLQHITHGSRLTETDAALHWQGGVTGSSSIRCDVFQMLCVMRLIIMSCCDMNNVVIRQVICC